MAAAEWEHSNAADEGQQQHQHQLAACDVELKQESEPAAAQEEAALHQSPSAPLASGSPPEDSGRLSSKLQGEEGEDQISSQPAPGREELLGAASCSMEVEVAGQGGSEGLQGQSLERQQQQMDDAVDAVVAVVAARRRPASKQQQQAAMDWEGSPACAAAPAPEKAAMLKDVTLTRAGGLNDAAVGAVSEGSLPSTEPAVERADSLLITVDATAGAVGSERSSGSLRVANCLPVGSQPDAAALEATSDLNQEQQAAAAADPPALLALSAGEGEAAASAGEVAGALEAVLAACEAHEVTAPQQQMMPQDHQVACEPPRIASFSAQLQRIARLIVSVAAPMHPSGLLPAPAAPAAAAIAAAATAAAATAAAAAPEAAATAAAGAAFGGSAVRADEEAEADDDDMPDQSDTGAMLRWARSRIPAELRQQYKEPLYVSEEDQARTLQRIEMYEEEMRSVKRTQPKNPKADATAASNLVARYKNEWRIWENTHGHKPGVTLGQQVPGRGWLWAIGVHTLYYQGIQSIGDAPAFAICLSGGYEDDDDHGDWLWYVGQGGRDNEQGGRQAQDQEWTAGNEAIRQCMLQRKPLRVCRGVQTEKEVVDPKTGRSKMVKKKEYTNDGLYAVIKARRVRGQGGKALVCKFLLVGIPGHYKANKSVSFVEQRGFRQLRLAGGDEDDDLDDELDEEGDEEAGSSSQHARRKRQKSQAERSSPASKAAKKKRRKSGGQQVPDLHPALDLVVHDGAWLEAQQRRPGFLCADMSGGVEKYQIPVFNEVDDEGPPQGLTYVRESVVGNPEAQRLLDLGLSLMPEQWCGLERGHSKGIYLRDGCMKCTRSTGHWECFPGCQKHDRCSINRMISDFGILLPLEVFRTTEKGWGLRCARDIPVGAFVCSYEGMLLAHKDVEARGGQGGEYLFDLEHFFLLHRDPSVKEKERLDLPPLPAEVFHGQEGDNDELLVIDANSSGNLARFINHSCEPNLIVQPVLRKGDSGMRYCVAIFAAEDIPLGTELCYNYNYEVGSVAGIELHCRCGAKKCKGRLI